jgi:hypothetical protein
MAAAKRGFVGHDAILRRAKDPNAKGPTLAQEYGRGSQGVHSMADARQGASIRDQALANESVEVRDSFGFARRGSDYNRRGRGFTGEMGEASVPGFRQSRDAVRASERAARNASSDAVYYKAKNLKDFLKPTSSNNPQKWGSPAPKIGDPMGLRY